MIRRCTKTTSEDYANYGGRGVAVCDEWIEPNGKGWNCFKKWAMENGYKENLTLDRIDNNGNYCPSNCRWITRAEQNRNKRNNIIVDGVVLQDLALKEGICHETLRRRYHKGIRGDELLKKTKWRYVLVEDKELPLKEFAKEYGFNIQGIENAFNRGTLTKYLIKHGMEMTKANSVRAYRKERGNNELVSQ